ncbi:F-box protein CPR1-like [Cornus florida]|uniref:F-box protein CPR1-like n=1 Tax=Cornus florida TaxID=4283 RepID=UPI00289F294A|nr:F-box protein CPR1-like [Cornus florida]
MSDFLPHDLLPDVLSRLPSKTLLRCACVCKSWYNLVINPSFITTHLNRSSLATNLLLIQSRSGDDAEEVHYSLLSCENETFCDYAELDLPLKTHTDPDLRIIGSCNGLVCLFNDFRYRVELYLWNPSIRKTMALPPLRVTSHIPFMHSIEFGFDSVTRDYKVVSIVYIKDDSRDGYRIPPEVDIFSLSSGTWRNISHLALPYTIYDRPPHAYLNGAAHWLACDMANKFLHLIMSFHMGDEIFGEIMVPSSIFHGYGMVNVRVAKFQESLSLIDVCNWGNTCCCIWVMNEYGISESWTKKFNIDMSEGLFNSVIGFTRKGEVIFGTQAGYLVAYDPEAERVMDLHIRGPTKSWLGDLCYADAYTESLVFLRGKFHDTVTCKESLFCMEKLSRRKKRKADQTKKKGL